MTGHQHPSEALLRSVLVISAHRDATQTIRSIFASGNRCHTASDLETGMKSLRKDRYDLIFIDLDILLGSMPGHDYAQALQPFRTLYPTIALVVMSAQHAVREAIEFVKAGASDYLSHPIAPSELKLVVEHIGERAIQKSELDYLRDQFWKADALKELRTVNALMKGVLSKIRSVAPTKTAVLLIGETGTGKGVMARLIHQHSHRKNAQFISVHCGAIPDTLLESEWFGHEKGAFTGAVRKKLGKFEIARGGTIFLDEIGTISPSAQIKLLQVLQDGTFNRVGGEETIQSDARVIAATNADLKAATEAGEFRKDLFYRLNVFPVELPTLRERIDDLPFFIEVFLERLNNDMQKEINGVHPQALAALKDYDWPGNIRELENLMERAYILENSDQLMPENFPVELFRDHAAAAVMPVHAHMPLARARQQAIESFERQYVKELLSRNRGRINPSASEAGISTRQLHKLMTRYAIRKEEFKV